MHLPTVAVMLLREFAETVDICIVDRMKWWWQASKETELYLTNLYKLEKDVTKEDGEVNIKKRELEQLMCEIYLLCQCTAQFAEIDKYLDEYDGENAYKIAKKLITNTGAECAGLCYRLAHACYIRSNYCVTNEQQRRALLTEAHDACHKAYKLEPKDADVLKWCSIITGSLADISCNKEKIELGHEFKKFLDEATALFSDSTMYHMRGRFSYEVANLSWLERTAATALFGAPPTATIDEALADLLKAEELSPGELDNLLFIAKCYLAKGMPQKARAYLMRMNGSNAVDEADAAMLEEARGLLKAIPDTELYSRQQATEGIGESKTESIVQENEQKEELMDGKTEEVDRSNTATPTT